VWEEVSHYAEAETREEGCEVDEGEGGEAGYWGETDVGPDICYYLEEEFVWEVVQFSHRCEGWWKERVRGMQMSYAEYTEKILDDRSREILRR
jgi:hypothetical protein